MKHIQFIICLFITTLSGCVMTSESGREVDTPTSGEINISVDETLQPIAEAQVDIFHHQYPNAKINIRYRSEAECVTDLYNDSCKTIFLGRQLNDTEMKAFKSMKFNPPQNKVATDAIALVSNLGSKDTAFSFQKVLEILRGKDTKYNLVFDNQNSGTVRYILNLTGSDKMPSNAFAASSNLEAVNYVAKHENTIGIIGWSWISDSDDPKTREYLSKVRLLALSPRDATDKNVYKPFQLNIAQNKYPLTREVYLIQRERRNGLSAGFTAFVLSDIGQTIMLKAGLLPAQQQDRWIELKTKSVGKVTN